MSLRSLLLNDTASFAHPVTTPDLSGGQQVEYPTNYAERQPVRVEDLSAAEIETYRAMGLQVTNRVFGQTTGVIHGDRIETSDGRYIRVEAVQQRRAIGNMPTFYLYIGKEQRPGA